MEQSHLEHAINAGRNFLQALDSYFSNHWKDTKCDDLFQIFDSFRKEMRTRRGGIAGVHGLSEYLLIRFLSYQLGGNFKAPGSDEGELDPTCAYPISANGEAIYLTQGLAATGPNKEPPVRPDIGIWRGPKLGSSPIMAAVEIKNWPTSKDAIGNDVKRLRTFATEDYRGLFVILPTLTRPKTWQDDLESASRQYPWFRYLVLQGNKELLAEELRVKLALNRDG